MKKILLTMLLSISIASAGFFKEEDKQLHMMVSVPFGAMGAMICKKDYRGRGLALHGWEAILCGTAFGMIPGLIKEAEDQYVYGGWSNSDLAADALGAFIGSIGTVTIYKFNSGKW